MFCHLISTKILHHSNHPISRNRNHLTIITQAFPVKDSPNSLTNKMKAKIVSVRIHLVFQLPIKGKTSKTRFRKATDIR